MAETILTTVQVKFEFQERITDNIKAYHIDSAFMTPTDGWSITLYEHTDRSLLHNLELQPVQLYVNGNLQLIGRVDSSEVGDDGHAVTLEGRDYLADLTECNVDPSIVVKEGMTLEQVILMAASPVGITQVTGDRFRFRNIQTGINAQTKEADATFLETKMGDYKANPGEGIYEFLNRIVTRHGATIQPTDRRDTLAIVGPNYTQESSYKLVRYANNPSGEANNILSATCRRDYSQLPTYVLVTGRGGKGGQAKQVRWMDSSGEVEVHSVTDTSAPTKTIEAIIETNLPNRDPNLITGYRITPGEPNVERIGNLYRLLYVKDELSKTQEQLNRVMFRVVSERVRNCLQYKVVLRGHEDPVTGATYAPDTIISVTDELCNLQEKLWVEQRAFDYSDQQGATTTLTCWGVESFLL